MICTDTDILTHTGPLFDGLYEYYRCAMLLGREPAGPGHEARRLACPLNWQGGAVTMPCPSPGRVRAADRFARLCSALVRQLPGGLAALVAPSVVGFALINGCTFGVDLAFLTVLRSGFGWPLWLAISLSYLTAFGLSFVLNRALNFRSHVPVGRQTVLYVAAIAVNYGVILLGVGGGLTALGLPYQASRIITAACEGVFMYCALRWVVFAERPTHRPQPC